jgi:hypothetical protein
MLDRCFGKPTERVEVEKPDPLAPFRNMPAEQLRERS